MAVVDGSNARHEIEIQFKVKGREESLYINRKHYWREDKLKLALRPDLSDSVSERILEGGCAVPQIRKGHQREAYSSNYRAFRNKPFAKGSKNEHFGHAWLVDINGNLSKLRQFLEPACWASASSFIQGLGSKYA